MSYVDVAQILQQIGQVQQKRNHFNEHKKMEYELQAKLMYPNPMKPAGIEFQLPEAAIVTVEIFNGFGASVEKVFNQTPMKAGKQLLEFNKFGLKDGEYTLRIVALVSQRDGFSHGEEYRMTKKIYIEGNSGG